MLGERIRKLRKQKKMTLEELAGNALTKGMLSLIENNKANPSMESLHYIAERLGVEVTDLLEEISSLELREVLDKAEELYNVKRLCEIETEVIDSDKDKEIIELIKPYISNLTQDYESARLLDIYSRSLYNENADGWQEFSEQAAAIYDRMNLTSRRVSIGIFRAGEHVFKHNYNQALSFFLSDRAKIEANHAYIAPETRLDLDYHEAVLYFAVGQTDAAAHVMEEAIAYSKKHRIFYRIDDLYRLAAGYAMIKKDTEKRLYYSKKLKQYGEFADDINSILFYHFMIIESLTSEKQHCEEAIEKINEILENQQLSESYQYLFYLEKGKALFGLARYEEALHYLEKVELPPYTHHPFDLSLFYVMDAYKALCHMHLENGEEALQFANLAMERFAPLPYLLKEFVIETHNIINKKINEA
ncbi:helix-turn-helix domain-containing protein [Bacillus sp. S/N-304-OC-R1]|uniref:helix-turn-helix domain-containing protein n=1 Tax=Bacillus sp. S/N-304-OC-R1 TaxID=2758034 RepID=UPI001C8E8F2A|nr:helix-turn-helix domain-containing protein [Bacillus sp. S/N-304-OC-R1]MBY0122108.1 helix-turn-helix domain-containing protein [Bacillus sp. S/N-304-OC-R1]